MKTKCLFLEGWITKRIVTSFICSEAALNLKLFLLRIVQKISNSFHIFPITHHTVQWQIMPFLLSPKFTVIFKGKKWHMEWEQSLRVEIRCPSLLRIPAVAMCVGSCYFPSISCPSAHGLLSEAGEHQATTHPGSPADPDDPSSASSCLPSRSVRGTPLSSFQQLSIFHCPQALMPSWPPQSAGWPCLNVSEKQSVIQRDIIKCPMSSL